MSVHDWLISIIPVVVMVAILIATTPPIVYHDPEPVILNGIEDQANIIRAGEIVEQRHVGKFERTAAPIVLIYEEGATNLDYSAKLNLRSVIRRGKDVDVYTQKVVFGSLKGVRIIKTDEPEDD